MSHDEPTWSAPSPSQPWVPPPEAAVEAPNPPLPLLPTVPPATPPLAPAPREPRPPRRRRFWWVAAVVVVLVAATAAALAFRPGGDASPSAAGSTGRSTSSSGSDSSDSPNSPNSPSPPRAAATAPLTAVDRTVLRAVVGDCLDVRDGLDDTVPATAAVVDCTDSTATFSVVSINRKAGAEKPCRSDSALESTNVDRVLCLRRVYQAGQCVLGNGARQFLASAVDCGEVPKAPFTQLFAIDAVSAQGVAATCTPPAVAVSTSSDREVCLRQVR